VIPRLIHFVWIGPPQPEWVKRNIAEFRRLNPEYEIRVHGEDALDPAYRPIYDQMPELASKADLIRYSVLARQGGWYFDTDCFPCRPIAHAERAWQLDGSRLFLVEQYEPASPKWLGNGVLAASADSHVWPIIRAMILATKPAGTLTYGPKLVSRFAHEHRDLVEISPKPWWYGVTPEMAGKVYRRLVAGDMGLLRSLVETGGQLPFTVHLWARMFSANIEKPKSQALRIVGNGPRLAVIAGGPSILFAADKPWMSIAEGLRPLGFRTEFHDQEAGAKFIERCSDVPEVVFIWNGMREPASLVVAEAERLHVPVIRLEHGFFDRRLYSQADHEGILHWASWRRLLRQPAPADGAARLARHCSQIQPMERRKLGYVLVLGQVLGDTQLLASEVQGPLPLQRIVARAMPKGVPAFFRPHPQCVHQALKQQSKRHDYLPLMGYGIERQAYRANGSGTGLTEALAGARFIVTINSNAINEALIAGVPCVAFGPSLALEASVVHPIREQTARADLQAMLDGWVPEQVQVENYLCWLACRQWTPAEFADPHVVGKLLADAGVPLELSEPPVAESRCIEIETAALSSAV